MDLNTAGTVVALFAALACLIWVVVARSLFKKTAAAETDSASAYVAVVLLCFQVVQFATITALLRAS